MINDNEFKSLLASVRPRLHRYCARMVGSAVDGEDVVQDVLLRAVKARSINTQIDNMEGWLLRVAHNASLDLLRRKARSRFEPLEDEMHFIFEELPQLELATVGFRTFLELSTLQRCAVVLKDVLGYTVEEVAEVAGCSAPAAKSALQRGRLRLREISQQDRNDIVLPLLNDDERRRMSAYVDAFRSGDFDAIRRMLADEVSVDLVNRLQLTGRDRVAPYFTRYAEAENWDYRFGAIDGYLSMLVYDKANPSKRPAHFIIIDWTEDKILRIRDFLFAPYAIEAADWVLVG